MYNVHHSSTVHNDKVTFTISHITSYQQNTAHIIYRNYLLWMIWTCKRFFLIKPDNLNFFSWTGDSPLVWEPQPLFLLLLLSPLVWEPQPLFLLLLLSPLPVSKADISFTSSLFSFSGNRGWGGTSSHESRDVWMISEITTVSWVALYLLDNYIFVL